MAAGMAHKEMEFDWDVYAFFHIRGSRECVIPEASRRPGLGFRFILFIFAILSFYCFTFTFFYSLVLIFFLLLAFINALVLLIFTSFFLHLKVLFFLLFLMLCLSSTFLTYRLLLFCFLNELEANVCVRMFNT